MKPRTIRHLLFDLGGVLYEIDIPTTVEAYNRIRQPGSPKIDFTKAAQHEAFSQLDRGEIDIDAFARQLKETYQLQGELATVKSIWRDLLIGVLPGRQESLQRWAEQYDLALLSNTNQYHFDHFQEACEPLFATMQRLFLSFEMGLRKPEPQIFQEVLDSMEWKAEDTLFIDDSLVNIEAAKALGIQTFWADTHEAFHQIDNHLDQKNRRS